MVLVFNSVNLVQPVLSICRCHFFWIGHSDLMFVLMTCGRIVKDNDSID